MEDDDTRPDNLIPISGSLVEAVADRIVHRVEGEVVSARAVREASGQLVLLMLDKMMQSMDYITVQDAHDISKLVTSMNGLVKLVQGAEMLELADDLPTDPVARRAMLEQFRAQARKGIG